MIKYQEMSLDANMVHRELQRFIKLDEAYQALFHSLGSRKDLMKFKAVTLAVHSTFDEDPCTRIRTLAATMTVMMMRT